MVERILLVFVVSAFFGSDVAGVAGSEDVAIGCSIVDGFPLSS